jgi:uncharacterized protein YjbI with pentapeptide repeats
MSHYNKLNIKSIESRIEGYIDTKNNGIVEVVKPIDDISILVELKSYISRKYVERTIIYDAELKFINEDINPILDFSGIVFKRKVSFSSCRFKRNIWFNECKFQSEVDFSHAKFDGKVRFHFSVFEKTVNFKNSSFKDLVDFYEAKFYATQRFWSTDFLKVAIFSNATFFKQVLFLHNKISSSETYISFEETKFEQSLDISRSNFHSKIQFWKCKIKNVIPNEVWLYAKNSLLKVEIEPGSVSAP